MNGRDTDTMKYQQGGFSLNITFICMIMCRHEENICYAMINHDHNKRLFHKYLLLQYNVTVAMGIFVRVVAKHPIIQEMQRIPLVWSDSQALNMTTLTVFPNYIIITDIEGNKCGVTILNNSTLGIYGTHAMQKNKQETL